MFVKCRLPNSIMMWSWDRKLLVNHSEDFCLDVSWRQFSRWEVLYGASTFNIAMIRHKFQSFGSADTHRRQRQKICWWGNCIQGTCLINYQYMLVRMVRIVFASLYHAHTEKCYFSCTLSDVLKIFCTCCAYCTFVILSQLQAGQWSWSVLSMSQGQPILCYRKDSAALLMLEKFVTITSCRNSPHLIIHSAISVKWLKWPFLEWFGDIATQALFVTFNV